MKYIQFLMSLILSVTILFSCGNQNKTERDQLQIEDRKPSEAEQAETALYEEVMAIHDEVMPKMDDMMRLKSQLQAKLEQKETTQEEALALRSAIKELEQADEAMMQWMRNFKPQDHVNDHQKVIAYYQEQKKYIKEVKDKMLAAIENARKKLN